MLISQLRCVPVCFYCSISLCRCQYFVVLVCFRRQMVGTYTGVRYSSGTANSCSFSATMVHKTEQNCKPLRFVHCSSIPDNKKCGPMRAKEKSRSQKKSAFGGHEGSRTLDLCNANAALSQLSYAPLWLLLYHAGGGRARGKLKFIVPIPARRSAAGCGAKKLPSQGSAREVGGKITFAFS